MCYLLIELVEYSLHHTVSNKALSSLLTADYKNTYSVLIKCDESKESETVGGALTVPVNPLIPTAHTGFPHSGVAPCEKGQRQLYSGSHCVGG